MSTIFTLISLTAGLVFLMACLMAFTQRTAWNPFRLGVGYLRRHSPFPPRMDWNSVFQIGLVALIGMPVTLMLYYLTAAFLPSMLLNDLLWLGIAGGVGAWGVHNLDVCCRFNACEMWPTCFGRAYPSQSQPGVPLEVALFQERPEYWYTVGGERYIGHKIDAHNHHHLLQPQIVRPGNSTWMEVIVYFHPDNPRVALLMPGVNWSSAAVPLGYAITCLVLPLSNWLA